MRLLTFILCCSILVIIVISLLVRDEFFVRTLSLSTLAILTSFGIVRSQKARHPQKARTVILLGALVLTGLAFTNAPLRVTFVFFESRFNAVSNQLVRGEQPDFPAWIGPFRVIDGGIRDGSGAPYLMTSGHAYEINGFVRDPQGTHFNLWSITPVSESWAYIEED